MLSNIRANIGSGNGLVPNGTAPFTDRTLILLMNNAQWTSLYICSGNTLTITIPGGKCKINYLSKWQSVFFRGKLVYSFGSVVVFILLYLTMLCTNQHTCWPYSLTSIQHSPLYNATTYGVTIRSVRYRLNLKNHGIRLTPHGWAKGCFYDYFAENEPCNKDVRQCI